ncbi:MAG: hypothetical protein ACKVUT_07400 [Gaiella sp.]
MTVQFIFAAVVASLIMAVVVEEIAARRRSRVDHTLDHDDRDGDGSTSMTPHRFSYPKETL